MRFSRSTIFIVILLLAASRGLAQNTAQAGTVSRITVKVEMIVTDGSNRSVDDIKQEQVQLFEDGSPQTISLFKQDAMPVDYALVMDNSGSFRDLLKTAIEAATLIVNSNGSEDETFVERFIDSKSVETVQEFTSDKLKLSDALRGLYVQKGQSAVVDALYLAVAHVVEHRHASDDRRRAVVAFTDGEDRNSFYSQDKLFKLVRENNIQVFVVGLVNLLDKAGGLIRASPRTRAKEFLGKLAKESGGRVFFPGDQKELLEATAQISHDLHLQYTLAFERQSKPNEKGFRKVRVKIIEQPARGSLTAITPPGFFVNAKEPGSKTVKPE